MGVSVLQTEKVVYFNPPTSWKFPHHGVHDSILVPLTCSQERGGASGQPEDQVHLKTEGRERGSGGWSGGWVGGIRSRERQYLQARGPELGAGRTERRSLSPRRGCPPAPSGEPDGETAGQSHQSPTATLRWRWSHLLCRESIARKCCKDMRW